MRQLTLAIYFLSVGLVACSKTPTSPTDVVPPPSAACIFSISTTTFNMAGSGGSATFSVNTGAGCAWTVTNNSGSFVTVSGATNQNGPGNVAFSVPENPGDTRVGTLTVAGQNVVINQAPNDQVYGNWGGTIVKGSGCAATLPASVDWTGTIRRSGGGATNEFVISIPSVGAINQVLALNITGQQLLFFVPIDTLYTFKGTLSSDRRSVTGTFAGGSCSGTWSGTRR